MKETEIHAQFRLVHIAGESALRRGPYDIEMVAPAGRTAPIYGDDGGREGIDRASRARSQPR